MTRRYGHDDAEQATANRSIVRNAAVRNALPTALLAILNALPTARNAKRGIRYYTGTDFDAHTACVMLVVGAGSTFVVPLHAV